MEGAAARDSSGPGLALGSVTVVATEEHDLTTRRRSAAVAADALRRPLLVSGVEEASGAVGTGHAVVSVACDVTEPSGLATLRRLRKLVRNARIVGVAPATDCGVVRRALDAGADGLVFESQPETSLIASLAAVAAGQTAVPQRVRGDLHKPAFSHTHGQVLDDVAVGLTNSEIAEALVLDPHQGPAMGLLSNVPGRLAACTVSGP